MVLGTPQALYRMGRKKWSELAKGPEFGPLCVFLIGI